MLTPSLGFAVTVVAYVVLTIAVPAVDAARRGRWGWVALIILLSPLGGVMWYMRRLAVRSNATAGTPRSRERGARTSAEGRHDAEA